VRSACFSPDARLAVSGSDDKVVKLWDVGTASSLHDFGDHEGAVNKVSQNERATKKRGNRTDKRPPPPSSRR
jgi:WD40 repeat protein